MRKITVVYKELQEHKLNTACSLCCFNETDNYGCTIPEDIEECGATYFVQESIVSEVTVA